MLSSHVHGMVVVKLDNGLFLGALVTNPLERKKETLNEKGRFLPQSYLFRALIRPFF